MIDLHIHTKYSDGSKSPIEILQLAQNLKLEYISITDHQSCDSYFELEKIDVKKYYLGNIISGIELKCCLPDKRRIELLGYGIDFKIVQQWLKNSYRNKSQRQKQKEYFDYLYQVCIHQGLKIDAKEEIIWKENEPAAFRIYQELRRYTENKEKLPDDLWSEFNIFARKYCGIPNNPFYIDKSEEYPTIEEAIKQIKQSGGFCFIAHPYIYNHIENIENLIEKIIEEYEIDGVECYYSTFTQNQVNSLVKICKNKRIYMSGGSDYHGDIKPNIRLGTGVRNLNIDFNIIKDWVIQTQLFI